MKTALDLLSAGFRLLFLKPFDFLLFGGNETITITRAQWQKTTQGAVRSTGARNAQARYDDGMDEGSMFPKWLTTNLPGVYDGAQGESFFMGVR